MYCSKCGLELPDDAKFCTFCGEPTDPLTSRQTQPTQPTPIPFQGTSVTPPRSSGAKGRIIAAVFIVGILLFIFGTQIVHTMPSTGITTFVVAAIVIVCIGCSACSPGRRRRGYGGGGGGCGDCGGCDGCGDCDCDCGGCDC